MDISTTDTSVPRARQLRDEPQSGRYPTREYQQRQPSLEHRAAETIDERRPRNGRKTTHDGEDGKAVADLTSDSHINACASAAAL
jgi:hypothetical protein